MKRAWTIASESVELAVECARIAEPLGITLEPIVSPKPVQAALQAIAEKKTVAIATTEAPTPEDLVALAEAPAIDGMRVAIAILESASAPIATIALAGDLGLVAVDEVRPLVAAIALLESGAKEPWLATTRRLPDADRARLASFGRTRDGLSLIRSDDGGVSAQTTAGDVLLGEPRDVATALRALRAAHAVERREHIPVEGVDRDAVGEIVFGPPRALSDPASKAALAPYGIPVPEEELCASPSRAASEASRIGFPVRIALASPELRVWDHPDLAVDAVDNAARVREVFRQIMALARARQPNARLLGVTVTATRAAQALLRVTARALPRGLVLAELGFADPHGVASGDHTHTVLPVKEASIERVLARLAGSALLLEGSPATRKLVVDSIAEVLLRLAAFVHDRREDVEAVEIDPLAILVGGGVEVREACVKVGDVFLRSLDER